MQGAQVLYMHFQYDPKILNIYYLLLLFLKAKLFYNLNQTLHDDSYNSKVRFRKRSKSIIVTRKSVRPFKQYTCNFYKKNLQQLFV